MKLISKFPFIIVLLFLSSMFSCADKFVNDLDIEIPDEEQQLVINLELTEGDTTAKTFVASTANLDAVDHTFFEDAIVDLYKEGELLTTLEYDQFENDYIANFDSDELTVGEYRVEVRGVPGFNDIVASQSINNSVNIIKGSYQQDGTIEQDYGYAYTVDEARVTIDDPADEENYYQVKLMGIIENQNGDQIQNVSFFVSSLNPFAETSFYYNGILLKDDSFNGTEFDLSMGFSNYLGSGYGSGGEEFQAYLLVELSSLSRDNYLFIKSEGAFQESIDNPFAEPVIVHNNVENGIGIFRTRNISYFRIDL